MLIFNINFWMNLILGEAQASNSESLNLSEAKERFYSNTYEHCNPIDKLKNQVKVYKTFDFFSLRTGMII